MAYYRKAGMAVHSTLCVADSGVLSSRSNLGLFTTGWISPTCSRTGSLAALEQHDPMVACAAVCVSVWWCGRACSRLGWCGGVVWRCVCGVAVLRLARDQLRVCCGGGLVVWRYRLACGAMKSTFKQCALATCAIDARVIGAKAKTWWWCMERCGPPLQSSCVACSIDV